MKNIVLFGAGKSSSVLIKYLSEKATANDWNIRIGDINVPAAKERVKGLPNITVEEFDISNESQLQEWVSESDIVVSLLPASMHTAAARACVKNKKNMVTASYVSPEMKELDASAKEAGVILLNEIGVDPGIDHMSAMQVIDSIRDKGGKLTAFESFTGGLLAPESEKANPWKYKFTWNPRNVVLAGQGVAKFRQEGKYKYIPYNRLFRRTEIIHIPGYGHFEGYANRDSLSYLDVYDLQEVKTIYRGTLRRPGYSRAWNAFVQLGATSDEYTMEDTMNMTYEEFINSFLYYHPTDSVETKLAHYMNFDHDAEAMYKLQWLGLFSDKKVGLEKATPAQVLQKILEDVWSLDADDKDMIVMWHKFNYEMNGEQKELHSSMVVVGDDTVDTAMAKTVGLPVAIATEMILNGKIDLKGVVIPTQKGIYEPVLEGLKPYGVNFEEREVEVN